MNFKLKYLKSKNRYLSIKYNNQIGSAESLDNNIIHIYYGGSFSPPTIAHQTICIDTIHFLMDYYQDSDINKIILHIVPTSDLYNKFSVKHDCIPFEKRIEMLKIIIQNIKEKIIRNEKYEIIINVDDIEQELAHIKNENNEPQGYLGTYPCVIDFATKYGYNSKNIYLLYGLDNAISLVSLIIKADGKIQRWKDALHLISKFKYLIYPRSGVNIDYELLIRLLNEHLVSFFSSDYNLDEININTGENNLDDVSEELELFKNNPMQFMQDHFIQVKNDSNECSSGDSISIAETSSSNIRKVLYDYSSYGFTIKPCIINENLEMIDSKIKPIILELYKNGINCEGTVKFNEILSSIPEEWKIYL